MDTITIPVSSESLQLHISACREYLPGFPMPASVTITNITVQRTYSSIPQCNRFIIPSPVQWIWLQDGKPVYSTPFKKASGASNRGQRFRLRPGESRTMFLELSDLQTPLLPGNYHLLGVYHIFPEPVVSQPVPVMIAETDPTDQIFAKRLREKNDTQELSWSKFILSNYRTIHHEEYEGISDQARSILDFYLTLHRVIYGPKKVEKLDPALFQPFEKDNCEPLQQESYLLFLEILHARNDITVPKHTDEILSKWPGLGWRLQGIMEGAGFLKSNRERVLEQGILTGIPPYCEDR